VAKFDGFFEEFADTFAISRSVKDGMITEEMRRAVYFERVWKGGITFQEAGDAYTALMRVLEDYWYLCDENEWKESSD
jgi:hypothetical protein